MIEVKANIEENGLGDWLIRVEDSFEEGTHCCSTMDDFAALLQEFSAKYEGQVNVQWSKDENLSSQNFNAVAAEISKLKETLDSQGE